MANTFQDKITRSFRKDLPCKKKEKSFMVTECVMILHGCGFNWYSVYAFSEHQYLRDLKNNNNKSFKDILRHPKRNFDLWELNIKMHNGTIPDTGFRRYNLISNQSLTLPIPLPLP